MQGKRFIKEKRYVQSISENKNKCPKINPLTSNLSHNTASLIKLLPTFSFYHLVFN